MIWSPTALLIVHKSLGSIVRQQELDRQSTLLVSGIYRASALSRLSLVNAVIRQGAFLASHLKFL